MASSKPLPPKPPDSRRPEPSSKPAAGQASAGAGRPPAASPAPRPADPARTGAGPAVGGPKGPAPAPASGGAAGRRPGASGGPAEPPPARRGLIVPSGDEDWLPPEPPPVFPSSGETARPGRAGKKFEVELNEIYLTKEQLAKWAAGFLVLALAVVAVIYWKTRPPDYRGRAEAEISKAERLFEKARGEAGTKESVKPELQSAEAFLRQAREALLSQRYEPAYEAAKSSQSDSNNVLLRIGDDKLRGDASIIEVTGKVEVQRAGRTSWEAARMGMQLYEGDYVKTGASGSIDIMSQEGTLFRIKPATLFEVHRSTGREGEAKRSGGKLVIGFIDMNTSDTSQTVVETDTAKVNVGARSNVGVDVDQKSKDTAVRSYKGVTRVEAAGGTIVLGDRERVIASRAGLSAKDALPDPPELKGPEDNATYDLKKTKNVTLKWSIVRGASRYHLQIARNRVFIPDSLVIDLSDRQKNDATLQLQEEGTFYWRVQTLGKGTAASDWSPPRRFRVRSEAPSDSPANPSANTSTLPPSLKLSKPLFPSGNLLIVEGVTDPGAAVTVRLDNPDAEEEPVPTDAAGNFKKILSVSQEGTQTVILKARAPNGKETVRREVVNFRF